jgi:hypothetical protein
MPATVVKFPATDPRMSAENVLRGNDNGGYTVPSRATYPHQWNWDSALIGPRGEPRRSYHALVRKLPIMYAPPIPVTTRRIFYTVKPGETLASIADKHRVSVEDIKRWNGVAKAVPGRTLALEVRAAKAKGKPRPKAKPKKRA